MNDNETIHSIRAFNRMYLSAMNLLGNHYLGSDYSIPEMRVLFEIHEHAGCTAAEIAKTANVDKSFLSRMIKKMIKQGHLKRVVSKTDGRSYCLYLTDDGVNQVDLYIKRSDEDIGKVIAPLNKNEWARFLTALNTVQELLNTIKEKERHNGNSRS